MIYKVESVFGKIKNKSVTVSVHGSKSIAARALMCASLARGGSLVYNVPPCDDSRTLIGCLRALGIEISVRGTTASVGGCGGILPNKSAEFNVGSSGTAARFLTALAALSDGEYSVNCSPQMKRRPVLPLINSLTSAGAEIISDNGRFPLKIKGKPLSDGGIARLSVDITESSQFLSGLMLAAAPSGYPVTISYSGSHSLGYAEMTAEVMRAFGAKCLKTDGTYSVFGGFSHAEYTVEPDVSAACYFYAANKILGTDIKVENLPEKSLQGDLGFIGFLKGFNGGRADMSGYSDQALTLAAIAPYLEKPTEIYGVPHIKKQECDRLNAIQVNLSRMGVRTEIYGDGIKIYPSLPRPARIESFGDHRVAMAFAICGLRTDGIVIENAQSVNKTFGDFFGVLSGICEALTK